MAQDTQKLVIVESPTKARTISKYLGDGYCVEASMGHVRDLPASADQIPASVKGKSWARIGVDVENDFAPLYIVPPEKKKVVSALRKALKNADALYIATDEDREGESIGWHLLQLLKPKVPTYRMVFHEITPEAVRDALASPRQIDERLVQAQEMRRVLDRLVGYTVSPLLWKKVRPRLSAGRVQSAAVRLLVMRERERMAFNTASYWDLKAQLTREGQGFEAALVSLGGTRLASGKDFDETTGRLHAERDVVLLDGARARALVERLQDQPWRVSEVATRQASRSPSPPFTTSTLQQEANRKLSMTSKMTMQVAQRLYENGHITYMRTDSVNLSEQALTTVRGLVTERYGAEFLTDEPRQFRTKSRNAQEAHEAIRPSGTEMRTARELGLSGPEGRLYELIWKRTVATQMADAQIDFTTARVSVSDPESGEEGVFRASGRVVAFPGYLRAYVEGKDSPEEALDDENRPLPRLKEGEAVGCAALEALEHETRPPARYTEATLVKALEELGIGRPSTYATIIDTVQSRGYVRAHQRQLVPTFTAIAVTQLLEDTHGEVVDLAFTASMEERLDDIAGGESADGFLSVFYKTQLVDGVERGADIDAREVCTIRAERFAPHEIRVGRYGPYIEYEREGEKQTVSLPEDALPADVDADFIKKLVEQAERGKEPLGVDPETGEAIYVLTGRFGPYVQLGEGEGKEKPKRQSLLPNMKPEEVDLETALALLALPREIGPHPEDGEPVKAGIGRYGPFVVHKRLFASLAKSDDLLTIGLERALELLTERAKRNKKPEVLRELGAHPEDEKPVAVYEGRYGPYVKHGRTNASLPDGMSPDEVTLEQALVLIAERKAKGKTKRSRRRRS